MEKRQGVFYIRAGVFIRNMPDSFIKHLHLLTAPETTGTDDNIYCMKTKFCKQMVSIHYYTCDLSRIVLLNVHSVHFLVYSSSSIGSPLLLN